MRKQEGILFLFRSTHDAIKAEKVLNEAGINPKVIPVPKKYSQNCGIALLLEKVSAGDAMKVLTDAGVKVMQEVDASE